MGQVTPPIFPFYIKCHDVGILLQGIRHINLTQTPDLPFAFDVLTNGGGVHNSVRPNEFLFNFKVWKQPEAKIA